MVRSSPNSLRILSVTVALTRAILACLLSNTALASCSPKVSQYLNERYCLKKERRRWDSHRGCERRSFDAMNSTDLYIVPHTFEHLFVNTNDLNFAECQLLSISSHHTTVSFYDPINGYLGIESFKTKVIFGRHDQNVVLVGCVLFIPCLRHPHQRSKRGRLFPTAAVAFGCSHRQHHTQPDGVENNENSQDSGLSALT
jgi:hypothetical protein